jgi:hypothetical protein
LTPLKSGSDGHVEAAATLGEAEQPSLTFR